jgi:hypothetical protein
MPGATIQFGQFGRDPTPTATSFFDPDASSSWKRLPWKNAKRGAPPAALGASLIARTLEI